MSTPPSLSQEEAIQRYWDAIVKLRKASLISVILNDLDLSRFEQGAPTDEETLQFLGEVAEAAWKAGFADALFAVENGNLVIAKTENN